MRELERLLRTRLAEVKRLEKAKQKAMASGARGELARGLERLRVAYREVARVEQLQREVEGIARDTELRRAALELAAKTRTRFALLRFHASQPMQPGDRARRRPPASYEDARLAAAVVVADRDQIREELARVETDPARAVDAARLRRELVTHEAHLDVLKRGLRALRTRS